MESRVSLYESEHRSNQRSVIFCFVNCWSMMLDDHFTFDNVCCFSHETMISTELRDVYMLKILQNSKLA